MRLILSLILALPLAAQLPVELMRKPSLSRSALAAGVQAGSANLLRYSGAMDNAAWLKYQATVVNNVLTATANGTSTTYQAISSTDAGAYTECFRLISGTSPSITVGLYDGSASAFVAKSEYTFATQAISVTSGSATKAVNGDGSVDFCVTGTLPAAGTTDAAYIYLGNGANAQTGHTVTIVRAQVNPGSTALPYVATTDLQSIASIPPGAATLVRGANSGSSTDDPQVSNSGWTLDSGDRVSGLPAKGANWTTTHCSGVECYTITSAGTEYINGVARRNWVKLSEEINFLGTNAWNNSGCTVTANQALAPDGSMTAEKITYSALQVNTFTPYQSLPARDIGTTYTFSVWLRADSPVTAQIYNYTGAAFQPVDVSITTEWQRFSVTKTQTGSTIGQIGFNTATGSIEFYAWGTQQDIGTVPSAYQKTIQSREWALETPGNYVGLLTWWGRWDRVLNPGEVRNNYLAWIRPRVNAAGNTLP